MNDVQHRVPAQSAARVCARAHLAYAHEHSIIHYPAGCRMSSRAAQRAGAARVCALARRAYARKQARDTGRAWRAAPERDSRACQPCPCFSPGQIGQASQLGIVMRGRDWGRSGAGR